VMLLPQLLLSLSTPPSCVVPCLYKWDSDIKTLITSLVITLNPFRSYVGPRPTWFSCSALMSEDVRHIFVAPALLSDPVRRFSSCSTDFAQHIAQIVLFLFLGRPCVLMWTGNCALYLRDCACRKMAGMKSWGVCGWQKNWNGKG
jgi:hypothetical protein